MKTKKIDLLKRWAYCLEEARKISSSLHHLTEVSYNYGLSKRQDTRMENLIKRADGIARLFNLRAYHQGDPRGCCLWFVSPADKKSGQYATNGIAIF